MNIYNEILALLQDDISAVVGKDWDRYKDYRFVISEEQQFNEETIEPNTIYIVVHFNEMDLQLGQTIAPITINALSEKNAIELVSRLLMNVAQDFNLKQNESGTIIQYFSSPVATNNFNEIADGFRSLFLMSASFLISENSNPLESITYYDDDNTTTEIKFLNANTSFTQQLDSQAFFGTNSETRSKGVQTAFIFNCTTYLVSGNALLDRVLKEQFGIKKGVNQDYYFNLKYRNGIESGKVAFKLVEADTTKAIGELPAITLVFAR